MPSAVRGETLGQKPLTEERGERETLSGAMETDEEESVQTSYQSANKETKTQKSTEKSGNCKHGRKSNSI